MMFQEVLSGSGSPWSLSFLSPQCAHGGEVPPAVSLPSAPLLLSAFYRNGPSPVHQELHSLPRGLRPMALLPAEAGTQ